MKSLFFLFLNSLIIISSIQLNAMTEDAKFGWQTDYSSVFKDVADIKEEWMELALRHKNNEYIKDQLEQLKIHIKELRERINHLLNSMQDAHKILNLKILIHDLDKIKSQWKALGQGE